MTVHELELPWDRPPMNMNQRMHWAPKMNLTKQIRLVGEVKSRGLPRMERCRIVLVWIVNTKHRRDTINASPTLKALVDGVVDAGVVADDDYTRVTTDIQIEYRAKTDRPACLVLRVTELPALPETINPSTEGENK